MFVFTTESSKTLDVVLDLRGVPFGLKIIVNFDFWNVQIHSIDHCRFDKQPDVFYVVRLQTW